MKSKYFVVVIVGVVGLLVGVVKPVVGEIKLAVVAQQSQAVEEWEKLDQQAEQLSEQGKYSEAIPLLERALVILENAGASETLDAAGVLNFLGLQHYYQGEYTKAETLYQRSLAIWKKVLGPDHPNVAQSLYNLASLYQDKGQYTEAESFYQQSLVIREKSLGPDHPDVAQSLNNLASLYQDQGRYTKAESLYQRSLGIWEKVLGPDHPDVAQSLNNLASLYFIRGNYTEAESLFQKSLAILEKKLGPDHPDVATNLNNLAYLYNTQGKYTEAEPLYQRSLAIWKKVLGPDHPNVASSLNNLALLYYAQGNYTEAECLYKRSLTIREKVLGADHPNVALSLNNLALLYRDQGNYTEAERLYKRSLAILEKVLGADHLNVALSLNNLALLYSDQGNYTEAERLYKRSLTIREKALGADHPDVATSLNNLALVYFIQGNYTEADLLLQQSLAILEKVLGPDHSNMAGTLNNLAYLYNTQGKYTEAERLYKRSLAIVEKVLGPNHPNVAISLNHQAFLYYNQGNYTEAERFYKRSLAIVEKVLGPNHPNVAISLYYLALLYQTQGNTSHAIEIMTRAMEVQETTLTTFLATGSESQKQSSMNTLVGSTYTTISLHLQDAPTNPDAANLALTTILRRKGRILDSITDSLQSIRQNLTPENQKLLDDLTSTSTQLANLYYRKYENRPPLEQYRQQLATLNAKAEKLEEDLSLASVEFRKISQPVTIEIVQPLIPTDAALVEIMQYKPFNPKAKRGEKWGQPHYAAYILHSTGAPQWLDLGAAEPIHQAVTEFRNTLSNEPNRKEEELKKAIAETKATARTLDKLVMEPIRQKLGNAKHILLSPDSQLNLIPFAALVDENNQYLVENYTITYLTSGRDLIRIDLDFPTKQAPILVAAPNYNEPGKTTLEPLATNNSRSSNQRSPDAENLKFGLLFNTKVEAEAIEPMLNVKALMGSEATENAIKQVKSPEIVHIATHGFFLEDLETPPPSDFGRGGLILESDFGIQALPFVPVENPLLRSGIALAGANIRKSGTEDGIMTALEIANLNLAGTKLVVLSACDTGVGEVNVGEGVYGLRRALSIAGSESQVISLWKVDDSTTKDLMIDYYERVLNKQEPEGRSEALRQVQLGMLENWIYKHPYYWASFVPSGDWRGM
ncbi:MAG: tetratricopeptide repeat protein [Trichodesmium sp. MO_231.B1]|nr:tetratricopeptide repeat protein [Trichodesmium sp. MO_231.B1]